MWQGALADCAECGTFGCNISYAIKEIMKMCASVCVCVWGAPRPPDCNMFNGSNCATQCAEI